MRILQRPARLLLACILMSGLAISANAAISGPHWVVPISATLTDWASAMSFPLFNPSLGTLYQVDVFVTSSISTQLTVQNNSSEPSEGNAFTQVTITATIPGGGGTMGPVINSPTFNYTLNAGQSTSSGWLNKTGSDYQSYTASGVLAAFTGPGTGAIPVTAEAETWTNNTGGNTGSSQITNASADGYVIYYYDPVPEPGSLLALGGGLVGFAAMIRRKK